MRQAVAPLLFLAALLVPTAVSAAVVEVRLPGLAGLYW